MKNANVKQNIATKLKEETIKNERRNKTTTKTIHPVTM
jgi:hypothetical protein